MIENLIWKGSPSQWVNFLKFVALSIIIYYVDNFYVRGICITIGIWQYLIIKCTSYEITNHRITFSKGVLSRKINNLELFRIKDIRLDQPFFLRLVNLSTLTIISSDQTNPFFKLYAVPNGRSLTEQIRNLAEERREAKGVKEIDISKLY